MSKLGWSNIVGVASTRMQKDAQASECRVSQITRVMPMWILTQGAKVGLISKVVGLSQIGLKAWMSHVKDIKQVARGELGSVFIHRWLLIHAGFRHNHVWWDTFIIVWDFNLPGVCVQLNEESLILGIFYICFIFVGTYAFCGWGFVAKRMHSWEFSAISSNFDTF